jgi:hypothetical protein
MVIGETKIEIKERHGQNLNIASIPERIRPALDAVEADRRRMQRWQSEPVAVDDIAVWADGDLTEKWGKKAPARVFHICAAGKDIEIDDPFAYRATIWMSNTVLILIVARQFAPGNTNGPRH